MNTNKILIDSREYKIILKPNIFKDNEKGRDKLVCIVNKLAKKQYTVFEPAILEEKLRKTWYLDTIEKDRSLLWKHVFT